MPMRRDCRHYESRTFANGEVIEKCQINLAPEAPWRCPEDCPGYTKRMMDAGWQYGSMAPPPDTVETDRPEPDGEDVAGLLDELQFIVNSAAPEVVADFEKDESRGLFRRKKKGQARQSGKKKGKRKKRR